jgi:ABC-type transporter Mla subunit MlaD
MPATKAKPAKAKPTGTTRTTKSAPATATDKAEGDVRMIDHISRALEDAQGDLASIGGSLGTGARDLRTDIHKMLGNARRDLKKLSKALQRDLEQLQKDLTKSPVKHARARTAAPKARKSAPQSRGASR